MKDSTATRRILLLLGGALMLSVSSCAREDRPNVILITIDTLRADHLSCYGYPHKTSPSIDKLCKEAVVFQDSITPTPTTDPAHSSIMTGLYPANHQVLKNGWRLGEEYETLAELLGAQGYQTQAFVSVFHLSKRNGFGQGFDDLVSPPERTRAISPDVTTALASDWLSVADPPFFLWIHYWDPHARYEPPPRHDVFKPAHYSGDMSVYRTRRGHLEGGEDLERIVSLYDGEIHFSDFELGKIIDKLRQIGGYDESMVIVTADHGELMTEIAESQGYGFAHGGFLFEGNVRVPLVIRFPNGKYGGSVVTPQVSNMDVMPTIAEWLGIETSVPVDGISLLPILRGAAIQRPVLFLQRRMASDQDLPQFHEFGVRSSSWKFVRDEDSDSSYLFDLTERDGEQTNVIDQHPEIANQMRSALDFWKEGHRQVEPQSVSDAQREALRALGYLP